MRLSLRSLVFLVPLLVAIVFACIAQYLRKQQADSIRSYREALLFGRAAMPTSLVTKLGPVRAREVIISSVDMSTDVAFDGFSRWAQILRVPNASGYGLGDGYTLFSLDGEDSCNWTLPEGTVLQSIQFDGNEIVFRLYGKINFYSYRCDIPVESPAEYRLEWKPGQPYPTTCVGDLMARDYCVEKNRTNK